MLIRFLLAALLAFLSPFASAQNPSLANSGVVTIGTRAITGSFGDLNVGDYGADFGKTLQQAINALNPGGGGVIQVLPGSYVAMTPAVASPFSGQSLKLEIRFAPSAIVTIGATNTATRAILDLRGTTQCQITGGTFRVNTVRDSQVAISMKDGFRNVVRDVTIEYITDGSGSNSAPMVGFLAENETEALIENLHVIPDNGVIGIRDLRGSGNQWQSCKVSNGLAQDTLTSFYVGADCLYGFEAKNSQFVILRDFRAWGLGTIAIGEVPAVIHWYSMPDSDSSASDEDGHSIIDSPHIELCCAAKYILIEGSQGWGTIENPNLGLSNYGIGTLGDAAIKITRQADYAYASAVQINAATSTFTLASGAWATTPIVGSQILTSGFANSANNGTFVVTSATTTTIVTTKYDGTASSLTTETGSGSQTIKMSRNSARWSVHGGLIHNVCRSRATAEGLMFLASAGLALADGATQGCIGSGNISVTASTKTFALSSGSWTFQPTAGQWFRTAGFAQTNNIGNFKIVSATASTVVVAETLTDEAAGGNEKIIAAYPYEGASIWIDYASDTDVRDVRITDQRSQWGLALDGATARGVIVDNVTFQKGSGTGAVAPIRLPTATLVGAGTGTGNYDDCEGLSISNIWMKSWGATQIPVGSATVGILLTASAPTITTTNSGYFPGLLGDNSAAYVVAGVGTDGAELVSIRNLDK